jgi:hypothetical protein
MAEPHAHELDGKLHDACAMCDLIRSRQIGAKLDKQTEQALDRHQKVAERSRLGRDELSKASKGKQP